jgi:cytochrome P450/NADPH-cytochrome P450 reductase
MSPPQGDTSGKPPKGEPIPQPPQHLFGLLGNLPDINPSFPLESVWKLSDIYGPIVKLNLRKEIIVLSNQKFINEVCDEERFEKFPTPALQEVRALLGDGLFTAYITEKNWWKAHRLLIPAFGPLGIQKMFPDMLDIGSQMVMKWDRQGPDHDIDCSDDLTRLGMCSSIIFLECRTETKSVRHYWAVRVQLSVQ